MKWDDLREKIIPLVDENKKPEITKIQVLEKLFSIIDINLNDDQWDIYQMKLEKYPQYDRCPWYREHIMRNLNGKLTEITFLVMENEILQEINTPGEKNAFTPLFDSINEGLKQISWETKGFFKSSQDMILSTASMIESDKSRSDSGVMDVIFGIAYFQDRYTPDLEKLLNELIYYKFNNRYHEII